MVGSPLATRIYSPPTKGFYALSRGVDATSAADYVILCRVSRWATRLKVVCRSFGVKGRRRGFKISSAQSGSYHFADLANQADVIAKMAGLMSEYCIATLVRIEKMEVQVVLEEEEY